MRNLAFPLLFISILAIMGFSLFYLGGATADALEMETTWPFVMGYAGILFYMMFGTFRFTNSTTRMGSFGFKSATLTMGYTLYLLICLLIVDLALLLGAPLESYRFEVAALGAFALTLYGFLNAKKTRVTEHTLELNNLQKPIKAVHLTDTHLGHFRGPKTMEKWVQTINEINPEVVFFTGDFLDSTIQLTLESMKPLTGIKAPVFFVEGNHDKATGIGPIVHTLKEMGIHVLENQMVEWNGIEILGLKHMSADSNHRSPHTGNNGPTVQSVVENAPISQDKTTVLLHHSPDGLAYAEAANVQLFLAGHTHGGQLWPISWIANALFELNRGLKKLGGMYTYVSLGTGTFGPPLRVGTFSEIAVLNLTPK